MEMQAETTKRRKRKRSFDEDKAKELLERGYKQRDVAILVGVNESNISRFLKDLDNKKQEVEYFKKNRPQALQSLALENLERSNRQMKYLDEVVFPHASNNEKINIAKAQNWFSTVCANISNESSSLGGGGSLFTVTVIKAHESKAVIEGKLDPIPVSQAQEVVCVAE